MEAGFHRTAEPGGEGDVRFGRAAYRRDCHEVSPGLRCGGVLSDWNGRVVDELILEAGGEHRRVGGRLRFGERVASSGGEDVLRAGERLCQTLTGDHDLHH